MNVICPRCKTVYRVDPEKVPRGGIRAQCAQCPEIFDVLTAPGGAAVENNLASDQATSPPSAAPGAEATMPVEAPAAEAITLPLGRPKVTTGRAGESKPISPFGSTDPPGRARRLARALISDIVVYNRDRWTRSLRDGTLRQEFREEIRRSWDEYAAQVGSQFARETSYFRDALNEILAEGSRVF